MTQDRRAMAAARAIQELIGPSEDCETDECAALTEIVARHYAPLREAARRALEWQPADLEGNDSPETAALRAALDGDR